MRENQDFLLICLLLYSHSLEQCLAEGLNVIMNEDKTESMTEASNLSRAGKRVFQIEGPTMQRSHHGKGLSPLWIRKKASVSGEHRTGD